MRFEMELETNAFSISAEYSPNSLNAATQLSIVIGQHLDLSPSWRTHELTLVEPWVSWDFEFWWFSIPGTWWPWLIYLDHHEEHSWKLRVSLIGVDVVDRSLSISNFSVVSILKIDPTSIFKHVVSRRVDDRNLLGPKCTILSNGVHDCSTAPNTKVIEYTNRKEKHQTKTITMPRKPKIGDTKYKKSKRVHFQRKERQKLFENAKWIFEKALLCMAH